MTDPKNSLPHAHQILSQFSTISYYKVNYTKSLILDLGLSAVTKWDLQRKFPFKWSSKGTPYLGITLIHTISSLVAATLNPLIIKVKEQLQHISQHELSWVGRLAAFKMVVLPQILYLFRAMPVHIPNHYFKTLWNLFQTFLWDNKKARCQHSNLIKHRSVGGAGVVDICDYFWAVHLDQLKFWLRN